MNDDQLAHLSEIKARLEAPSWFGGGRDAGMAQDMHWLIALVESQAKEIEQLKSSLSFPVSDLLRTG